MIINFKIFENQEYKKFKLQQFSCWIIYGDTTKILKILEKIQSIEIPGNYFPLDYKMDFVKLKFRIIKYSQDQFINGIILYFGKGFSYSILNSEKEKEEKLNLIMKDNIYKFKGEIKLINNKLYLDTLELDMKKYNL